MHQFISLFDGQKRLVFSEGAGRQNWPVAAVNVPEAFCVSDKETGGKRRLQLQRANSFTPASYFRISSRWIFWFHWWSNVWCLTSSLFLTGLAADRMTLRRSCDTVSLAQSTGRTSTTRRWEQDVIRTSVVIYSNSVPEIFWSQGYLILQKAAGWDANSKIERRRNETYLIWFSFKRHEAVQTPPGPVSGDAFELPVSVKRVFILYLKSPQFQKSHFEEGEGVIFWG